MFVAFTIVGRQKTPGAAAGSLSDMASEHSVAAETCSGLRAIDHAGSKPSIEQRREANRESDNVEDRRGEDGGGGFGLGGRSIGIGTVAIALVASYFFGISPGTVISLLSGGQPAHVEQAPAHAPPANDQMAKFVSTGLADTEDTWSEIFRANSAGGRPPGRGRGS